MRTTGFRLAVVSVLAMAVGLAGCQTTSEPEPETMRPRPAKKKVVQTPAGKVAAQSTSPQPIASQPAVAKPAAAQPGIAKPAAPQPAFTTEVRKSTTPGEFGFGGRTMQEFCGQRHVMFQSGQLNERPDQTTYNNELCRQFYTTGSIEQTPPTPALTPPAAPAQQQPAQQQPAQQQPGSPPR